MTESPIARLSIIGITTASAAPSVPPVGSSASAVQSKGAPVANGWQGPSPHCMFGAIVAPASSLASSTVIAARPVVTGTTRATP